LNAIAEKTGCATGPAPTFIKQKQK